MWQNFLDKRVTNLEYIGHVIAQWLDQHLVNIIIILIGCYILRKFGTKLITRILHQTLRRDLYPTEVDRKKRLKTLDNLTGAVMRAVSWMLATFMIVSELGIDTAPLLASAGVVGLAISFGAQSLVKDFVTGVFIITENQYRVGDIVEINNVIGKVEAITIRTTLIRSLNGNLHHVPNGTITVTTNKTMDYGSLNEEITVSRDTDVNELEYIINHVGEQVAAMAEFKDIVKEAPHFSSVQGLTSSGLTVKILGKTSPGDTWRVKSEMYKRLAKAFEKHHIEMPVAFPVFQPTKAKR
jgi:small conductance mechanosensitive channel